MDIPLLLGTAFTAERGRATAVGYAIHFLNGLVFSLVYGLVFAATGARELALRPRASARRTARSPAAAC